MRRCIRLALSFLFICLAAPAADLVIPSASGSINVDGLLDEEIWKSAAVLPLSAEGVGAPFPAGGEIRVVRRGSWLCLGARLPDSGRIVARSSGTNPAWWREDLITVALRFRTSDGRTESLTLGVNPLGAYRVDTSGGKDGAPVEQAMAAAVPGSGGWTVEAVAPAPELGFISVERVRAPRPDAPELRWRWPGPNDSAAFRLKPEAGQPAPVFRPKALERPVPEARSGGSSLDSVRHSVFSPEEHKRQLLGQMVPRHLQARVMEAALAERREWEKVTSLAGWEKFRDQRLGALKASLGPFPARTPLKAEVTRRMDYGSGFVIENVVFESRPRLVVTANLYLPDKISGRIPAIVVVHSHHAPKFQSELQDMGMTWARNGTAVLVMDQLGAGERIQSQAWPRESYYSRYAMGMQLDLTGESLMKWMVWDLMRGIDMLLERSYIDPARIVMLGAVAGGGDPAAVTASLDQRVAAVIPFNFGESGPEEHYTEGPRPYDSDTADPGWGSWETTRNLRRSIGDQFFPWFICASVAPRRFIFAFEMGWPNGVEQEPVWKRYKKVFELNGKRDHLDEVDGFGPFPGPGECTNAGVYVRKKIYPILNRWLGVKVPAVEFRDTRPEAELACLTPAAAAQRRPRTASEIAFELGQARLGEARRQTGRLKTALAAKLGDIEPRKDAAARTLWSKAHPDFDVEAVSLESEPGITVPFLLLKPKAPSERVPAVLALAQGGKETFLRRRGLEVETLLKAGVAVCLADVRGTGETASTTNRGPGGMSPAATEFMFGRTMLGARLKDARTVVRYLAGRADVDPKRLAVWGDSAAPFNPREMLLDQSVNQRPGPQPIHQAEPMGGLLALLTAFYENGVQAAAARRGLVSYLSVLKDRFAYVPQDVIVPGILEAGDVADVVASLAPRAVLIEEFVDGRNRLASERELTEELETAIAAYRAARSQLTLRESPGEPGLAEWIVARLAR